MLAENASSEEAQKNLWNL